jgi:glycosyltransferase involved in cell wall biosynthesis
MTRVLHLIPDLGLGGAQRALCYLAAAMDQARYRVEVAYWGVPDDLRKELEGLGVDVVHLDPGGPSLPRLAAAVGRRLRRGRPDIVHTHLFDADLVGVLAARAVGIGRCCSTIHSFTFFSTRAHRWRYRWLLAPLAGRFFPVSHALGTFLIQRCGLAASKVRVILNGIDAASFGSPPGRDVVGAGGPIIGTLARLDARKGIRFLLEALARLLPDLPQASLIVGGEGEERGALEGRARALGIAGRVTFAGPVRDHRDFYRGLDLFALPSLDEGFGLVVLEAMAAGLPVIGARAGGIPEILQHDVNGLLVPPGDAAAIAEGVRALWGDPALRRRLLEGARRTLPRFDIARTAAETQAAYEALA